MATETDDAIAVRIAQQVATLEDVDPIDLEPPLYEVVDVDALEALCGGPTSHEPFTGSVSFDYRGYTITVDHEGSIDVLATTANPVDAGRDPTGVSGGSSADDGRLVGEQ
ncbi:HalOD1 output domain-containing protein [Natrarchaeobaculum aegyptiacum]|uniref:Halobacterial output domain-containing protein n=1 Tax=Natrarchaeobaculum aegyptiacum TaxID=745377 RepID=A0A2Z2HVD5_9EURY|nr:HalOD1 output domain-containing protein [Natrarchaeobaculum aegyptiacum]ARS90135.1 hypothetical protein B1756_10610 [Natrarchaeobaculum aegyptiacum]